MQKQGVQEDARRTCSTPAGPHPQTPRRCDGRREILQHTAVSVKPREDIQGTRRTLSRVLHTTYAIHDVESACRRGAVEEHAGVAGCRRRAAEFLSAGRQAVTLVAATC